MLICFILVNTEWICYGTAVNGSSENLNSLKLERPCGNHLFNHAVIAWYVYQVGSPLTLCEKELICI